MRIESLDSAARAALEEEVDRYVLGEMDSAAREEFEDRMAADAELREYVALRREVVAAVREKESLRDEFRRIEAAAVSRRRKMMRWTQMYMSTAVAACLVAGVFVRVGDVRTVRSVGLGGDVGGVLAQLQLSRGGGVDFAAIVADMDAGRFSEALEAISEYREAPAPEFDLSTERGQYEHDLYVSDMQALDYLQAVTYMRGGKPVKARRLLKTLASGETSYWQQAAELLLEKL